MRSRSKKQTNQKSGYKAGQSYQGNSKHDQQSPMYQGNNYRQFQNNQHFGSCFGQYNAAFDDQTLSGRVGGFAEDRMLQNQAGSRNFRSPAGNQSVNFPGRAMHMYNNQAPNFISLAGFNAPRDDGHAHPKNIHQIFDDVLGEKPPESNANKSSNHQSMHQDSYNNSLSDINSPPPSAGKNSNHNRHKWRRDDRQSKHRGQGSTDANWETDPNYERFQRPRERYRKRYGHNSASRDCDKNDQGTPGDNFYSNNRLTEESKKSQEKSQMRTSPTGLPDAIAAKATLPQSVEQKSSKGHKTDARNGAEKATSTVTSKANKSKSSSGRKTAEDGNTSSSSLSSDSESECMIDDSNRKTSAYSNNLPRVSDDSAKLSKIIMQSTSTATKGRHAAKDPPKKCGSENKKKQPEANVSKVAASTTSSSGVTSAVPDSSNISPTATSTVKKPPSKAELLKMITPCSRRDQQRVEVILKECWKKRGKTNKTNVAPVPSKSGSNLLNIDLTRLDFKALKTDIPEELTEVINTVFNFDSTVKNPIVLDDDDDANSPKKSKSSGKTSDKTRVDKSSKKRKASEAPSTERKRTKEGKKAHSSSDNTSCKDASVAVATSEERARSKSPAREGEGVAAPAASTSTNEAVPASESPAPPRDTPSGPPPESPGILKKVYDITMQEEKLRNEIARADQDMQRIRSTMMQLEYQMECQKQHRLMLVYKAEKLKTLRIQALEESLNISTKDSKDDRPMSSLPQDSDRAVPEESGLDYNPDSHALMNASEIINIVPQLDGNEEEERSKQADRSSSARNLDVPSFGDVHGMSGLGNRNSSLVQQSEQAQRPILSPPPRPVDNPNGEIRYLGSLNNVSHLFRKPDSVADSATADQGRLGSPTASQPSTGQHNLPSSESNRSKRKDSAPANHSTDSGPAIIKSEIFDNEGRH